MSEQDLLKKTYITLKQTQQKLEAVEAEQREPLAIVGMSCRFPGGGNDPEKFWKLLAEGIDASSDIPADRWESSRFYDPAPDTPGTTHAARANFLNFPVYDFDAHFFNISAKESLSLDPQQRLLLEVTWEAIENAQLNAASLAGSRTGVFIGISSDDYTQAHRHSANLDRVDAYALTGTCFAPAAGRLSYTFGFEGPSLAVDTACSSSLVALHLGCRSLREKESDLVVVGGVNLILSPVFHICSTKLGTISPDGRCKTFDASANGYGRGEGCGVVVVKRLSDAIKANDLILAIIRGTAVNQDGKSNGLTAPNGLAQEKVIRAALQNAGLSPGEIGSMEAHGTGTSLGDPIEVESIGRIMREGHDRENPVFLSSVKTNIGHLEAAAGISGLIKVIQTLRYEQIPPHLHMKNPSPYIPWERLPVEVPKVLTPWKRGEQPRRAGISSFGFSGTNAHVILEEAPLPRSATPRKTWVFSFAERPVHVLPLSARNPEALRELAARYAHSFENHLSTALPDICHTAGTGRSHFNHRLAVFGKTADEMRNALQAASKNEQIKSLQTGECNERAHVAFLFTGQGSQYVGMGRELWETQPEFREAMQQCDALFQEELHASLIDEMYGENASDEALAQTQSTQAAIFSIEYALAKMWSAWGILPDWMAGHSIGEYAAACIAGILTLNDAVKLVAARGRLMQNLPPGGRMAAVFAKENEIEALVQTSREAVSIAAVNAPQSVVISGSQAGVESLTKELENRGIAWQALNVSHAFHSPLMEPILDEFEKIALGIHYGNSRVALISTLTGKKAEGDDLRSAHYWREQIRKPVRFQAVVERMAEEGVSIFLEIGAMPTLTGLARRTVSPENAGFIASLKKGEADWGMIASGAAELYVRGVELDWVAWDSAYPRKNVSLPTYPFQRKRYYTDLFSRLISTDLEYTSTEGKYVSNETRTPNFSTAAIVQKLNAALDGEQISILTELVHHAVRTVLGDLSIRRIQEDRPLMDQGFDSLTAVELRTTLSEWMAISLPVTFLFNYPTIRKIAIYLNEEFYSQKNKINKSQELIRPEVSPSALLPDLFRPDSLENLSEDELKKLIESDLETL